MNKRLIEFFSVKCEQYVHSHKKLTKCTVVVKVFKILLVKVNKTYSLQNSGFGLHTHSHTNVHSHVCARHMFLDV